MTVFAIRNASCLEIKADYFRCLSNKEAINKFDCMPIFPPKHNIYDMFKVKGFIVYMCIYIL